MKDKNIVYIAFGSNKGDALANIKAAVAKLGKFGEVKQISPLFKTKPEGFLEQEDFINGALCFATALAPNDLLKELKNIELLLGRIPSFKNAPREIDLDIIFYNNTVLDTPALKIPHPLCHTREFVLRPLSAIAPDIIHPVTAQSVSLMLSKLMEIKKTSDCVQISGADL